MKFYGLSPRVKRVREGNFMDEAQHQANVMRLNAQLRAANRTTAFKRTEDGTLTQTDRSLMVQEYPDYADRRDFEIRKLRVIEEIMARYPKAQDPVNPQP